ncbi:MAG: TetR/AcrR family transcriptional regulator [Solirubrobacteraceae bacterium]
MSTTADKSRRQRIPAAERRNALIDAAMIEFAHGGLHGTPVDRIARRVGVAQPYVFSLFASKRDLFIAAIERGFERVATVFTRAAAEYDPALAEPGADVLMAMGRGYVELVASDRTLLMLQHHGYAACDDETIRAHVRGAFARLVTHVEQLSGAGHEQIDEFMRFGMWLNVQAAMGVEDLSSGCEWIRAESARDTHESDAPDGPQDV